MSKFEFTSRKRSSRSEISMFVMVKGMLHPMVEPKVLRDLKNQSRSKTIRLLYFYQVKNTFCSLDFKSFFSCRAV